jgi:hypothetical protein
MSTAMGDTSTSGISFALDSAPTSSALPVSDNTETLRPTEAGTTFDFRRQPPRSFGDPGGTTAGVDTSVQTEEAASSLRVVASTVMRVCGAKASVSFRRRTDGEREPAEYWLAEVIVAAVSVDDMLDVEDRLISTLLDAGRAALFDEVVVVCSRKK